MEMRMTGKKSLLRYVLVCDLVEYASNPHLELQRSLVHLPLPKHSWIKKPREWFHSKKSKQQDMRSASTDAIHNHDGDDDTDEEVCVKT